MSHYNRHIESYVHNHRIGVLVEFDVSSFGATEAEFIALAKSIAMHIASAEPATVEDLLKQPYVKEPALTVGDLLDEAAIVLGERSTVTRFVRWVAEPDLPRELGPDEPRTPAMIQRSGSRLG